MKNSYDSIKIDFTESIAEILLPNEIFVKEERKTNQINIHKHSYVELFFVGSDPLTLSTENGEYEFQNSVVAVPYGLKHFVTNRKNVYYFLIKFTNRSRESNNETNKLNEILNQNRIVSFSKNELLFFYLFQLQQTLKEKTEYYELKIKSILTLIVLELLNAWQIKLRQKEKSKSNHSDYVFTIEQLIQTKFNQDLTLKEIAQKLFLSEKQTSRFIKKEFGDTLSSLINDKKLSVAKMLLKNTDMRVSKILEFLNYKTENYFYSQFKKKYNLTPLAYRKKTKNDLS